MSLPDVSLGNPAPLAGATDEVVTPAKGVANDGGHLAPEPTVANGPKGWPTRVVATPGDQETTRVANTPDGEVATDDGHWPLHVVATPSTEVVATDDGELPDDELDGDIMSATEQARLILGHWFRQVRNGVAATAKKPGGFYHARPKSFADHDADIAARHWVPEGFEWKLLVSAWVVFQYTIGKAGMALGYAIQWTTTHAFAFLLVAGLIVWLIYG